MELEKTTSVNGEIVSMRENGMSVKGISDSHHTFGDLYDMRAYMFAALCNAYNGIAWKSKKHYAEEIDPMFNGSFIAGINTPDGLIAFHLKLKYWDMFDICELDRAPMYDGYTEDDVKKRLLSLNRVK